MAALSPIPSLEAFNLTFHESTLVFPSQPTKRKTVFVSNLDMLFKVHVKTVHFFNVNPDFPIEKVARRLKMALEKVLVPYDFVAGRLKVNAELRDRVELDCNAGGAGFVVASSEVSLDDIGDGLGHPNLGYRQLAVDRVDGLASDDDQPLFVIQITSFRCGGFAVGMSMNHILFDGLGAKIFLENLVSQTFDNKPLAIVPCVDRNLLAARSPPIITFPHPEFLPMNGLSIKKESILQKLEFRIFKLSPFQTSKLKDRAKTTTSANSRISSFAAMAALMWRCRAFSNNEDDTNDEISMLLNIINIRERVNPPLSMSYSANAVLLAAASAKHREVKNGALGKLVELISEGPKGMTDKYVKSAIDWLEVNKVVLHGKFVVCSWMRLGFDQVTYPWGKPMYSCPVVYNDDVICFIFPDAMDGGISAMVALTAEKMKKFEAAFHDFFA